MNKESKENEIAKRNAAIADACFETASKRAEELGAFALSLQREFSACKEEVDEALSAEGGKDGKR